MKKIFYTLFLVLAVAGITTYVNREPSVNAQSNELQTQTVALESESCRYLSSYLKFGEANNVEDVYKLQAYLHLVEGIDVSFNGIFDRATYEGVKVMQERHRAEILTPWNISEPTGNVYITTKHFLDEWSCGETLPYTQEETDILLTSIINRETRTGTGGAVGTTNETQSQIVARPTTAAPTTPDSETVTIVPTTPTLTLPTTTDDTETSEITGTTTDDENGTTSDEDVATSTGFLAAVGGLFSGRGATIALIVLVLIIMYFLYNAFSRKPDATQGYTAKPNQTNNPNQNQNQKNQQRPNNPNQNNQRR